MLVSSNEDCPATYGDKQYLTTYGKNIGLTSIIATQPETFPAVVVIKPIGNGYIANKNRVLGAVSRESPCFSVLKIITKKKPVSILTEN